MTEYIISRTDLSAIQRTKIDLYGGVEMVRCKDCYWHYGTICRRDSTFPWEDDDYCSKAEVEE